MGVYNDIPVDNTPCQIRDIVDISMNGTNHVQSGIISITVGYIVCIILSIASLQSN